MSVCAASRQRGQRGAAFGTASPMSATSLMRFGFSSAPSVSPSAAFFFSRSLCSTMKLTR